MIWREVNTTSKQFAITNDQREGKFFFVRSGALCFQSHTSVTRQTFTHCNSIFRVFETFRSSWKCDYVFPSIVSTPFYESLGLHTAVCMVGHQSMGDVCRPPRQPPRRLFCEGSSFPDCSQEPFADTHNEFTSVSKEDLLLTRIKQGQGIVELAS